MRINENQRSAFVRKVRNALWTLKGKQLAVLGLAFKGGTDDVRESPAIALVHSLLREGCAIRAYDPAAMRRADNEFSADPAITFSENAYDAVQGADALLVLTDWEEFLSLDFGRIRSLLRQPIVFDGRNLYNPSQMQALGFFYFSVGRRDIVPDEASATNTNNEEAA
jgi:UDPglucose 6-dehydrogenase